MSEIYNKNLQEIKKLSIDIYRQLKKENRKTSVKIKLNKAGQKNIIKIHNDSEFLVHSNYDVRLQSKVICDYAHQDDKEVVVIFGMGLGYEVDQIIKKAPKKKYIIIEPAFDIFKLMVKNIDFTKYLSGNYDIKFIIGEQSKFICNDLITKLNEINSWNIKFIILPYHRYIYKNIIDKVLKTIKERILIEKINIGTTLSRDRQWVFNYAKNTQYLNETLMVSNISECKNIPAIIVGAGPSLELNLSHLKTINRKAVIVGAGNSVKILEENNIKADIVGAIDSSERTEEIYRNLNLNKDSIFFYSTEVFSKIPQMFNGKKYLMIKNGMDNYINNKISHKHMKVVSGPSITNILAYNLSLLGFNPIIFLGQDMCGSKEKFYAKGSIHDNKVSKTHKLDIEMYNKIGKKVITNNAFLTMKISMEDIIKHFPKTTYLNGTHAGLNIEGAVDIDFNNYAEDVLVNLKDINLNCFDNQSVDGRDDIYIEILNDVNIVRETIDNALKFIQEENDEKKKKIYIKRTNKSLDNMQFYRDVLKYGFGSLLDTLYRKEDYIDQNEKKYMYYLDKCNVMIEGLNSIKLGDKKEDYKIYE